MTTTVLGDRIGNRVVSYGFSGAGYETDVPDLFKEKGVECLTYIKLDRYWDVDIYRGYDDLLDRMEKRAKRALWKAGLVNLVLDNYQKSLQDLPITPCLFCVDADGMQLSIEDLLMNHTPASFEVRRAYKLCQDTNVPEEIRKVAEKTFIFVRVHKQRIWSKETDINKCFSVLPFPWDTEEGKDWIDYRRYRRKICHDPVSQGFWRSAVIAFYTQVTPIEKRTITETTQNKAIYRLRGIPVAIREAKDNEALALISKYLEEDKRDRAIKTLDQIAKFANQQEAVRRIVAYDLNQSPPNYDGAADLAWSERYGWPRHEGGLGCPEAQILVIEKVAKERENGVVAARGLIDRMIPNSHHKEEKDCSCYPCSAKASVNRIEESARLKSDEAKGTLSSSK